MTYTGDVTPQGPADVRDLDRLVISKMSVGPMDNNAYLLRCKATGEQIMIDAAADAPRLLELVGDAGLSTVVTTHRHMDHWWALADVVEATGAQSLVHRADAGGVEVPSEHLVEGDTVRVGECALEVIHIVGHTPGSIALLYLDTTGGPHLFTGDSLFPGGVGNTENDPARFGTLIDDVEHKLFDRLPDETWFYPGHGKDSTLGAERPQLAQWRSRGW